MKKLLSVTFSLLFIYTISSAAELDQSPMQVELILDASRSMRNTIKGISKISIAKRALIRISKSLGFKKEIQVGLRIFGHRSKLCNNTILEVPIASIKPEEIESKIKGIIPVGNTPIAYSLIKSAADFNLKFKGRKIVIIITDGRETCKDDPCDVATKLKRAGVITRIHIVALGMSPGMMAPLKCIVKPSGGMIIRADDPDMLSAALIKILKSEDLDIKSITSGVSHNLHVSGRDKDSKRIGIIVKIVKNKRIIESSKGENVTFNLEKGVYDLHVKSLKTGKTIVLNGVQIRGNKVERRIVFFGKSKFIIRVTDIGGRDIDASVEIFRTGTGILVSKRERVELKVDDIRLNPGLYDLKIKDLDTGKLRIIKGFRIEQGTNEKAIRFQRGTVKINGVGVNGIIKFTAVKIYRSGTKNLLKKSTGAKFHSHILLPGKYDIKVNDWYGKGEKWIRGLDIRDGDDLNKEVLIK